MLLESVEDVKTKIQLKRREKPLEMRIPRPEAMGRIVEAILEIAELECRVNLRKLVDNGGGFDKRGCRATDRAFH